MSSVIAQSNGDARTAISSKNEGRIQLSELYLSKPFDARTQIHLGLLDSTLFFDTGNIANNENTQFIASDFVNNPIIDFPDYALAMVVEHQFTQINTTRLMLSSTNGLADNPNRDYSSLFEVNSDDKGLFTILETEFSYQQSFFKLGAWMHNGDHQALDNTQETRLKNYGAYLTTAKTFGNQSVEFRAGTANEKVSSAAQFVSLAYQLSLNDWTLGSAYGMTKTSKFLTTPHRNIQEIEVYGRYQLTPYFSLTPSVQYFNNPFYNSNLVGTLPNDVWAMNLRANIAF